ncbi:MAG TPA: hypothetical protein DCY75_05920, partial [Clostridiales bacterium]|nr:hypothetical protein [Clostridiales bacterium]
RTIYDTIGVEKGLLLPSGAAEACRSDMISPREAHDMVQDFPETLGWWFCSVNPAMGSNSEKTNLSYFLLQYKEHGAKGVGEMCFNDYFDDPLVLNLLTHCEKCQMPVLFHIGRKGNDYGLVDEIGLPRLEKVLGMFPDLIFIGHSQKFWAEISKDVTEKDRGGYPKGTVIPGGRVIELMRTYKNLHADLSARSGFNALKRDPTFAYAFLEEFPDRIYYGTDICSPRNIDNPMLGLSAFLDDAMLNGNISYDTYFKVSRGNALRLLDGKTA